MEKYKIKVNNEAESKEAQELFFELGYCWITGLGVKNLDAKFLYAKNNQITMGYCSDNFSDSGSCELTIPKLRDMVSAYRKPKEQELISGADALRALADGKEVEHKANSHMPWGDASLIPAKLFSNTSYQFRLKPRTITLNIEIPATFEPKNNESAWVLDSATPLGYKNIIHHVGCVHFACWRTEEEIKQVVEAFRGALKNG